MKDKKQVAVIFCPPLSDYKEQPNDVSKCEVVDCPLCNERMWFSEKKKAIKEIYEENDQEIFFGCYNCFLKEVKDNSHLYVNSKVIRIDI